MWASGICRSTTVWMELTILGWLTFHITGSPFEVALIGVYRSLPLAVVGPFSGLISDRVSRKLVIELATAASIVASATLAYLIVFDLVEVWHIQLTSAVLGSCVAFEFPARRVLTREQVGSRLLVNAVSLDIIGFTLSNIFAPIVAGILLATTDAGIAFSVVVFVYGLQFLFVALIKYTWSGQREGRNVVREMKSAFGYVRGNRYIMGVLAITVAANILAFPFIQFLPVFSRDVLDVGPALLGVMTAAFGIGMFSGSMVLASMAKVARPGATYVIATGFMVITLLIFAVSKSYGLSVLMLGLAGFGMSGFAIFQSALLLTVASEEFRGRVMGLLSLAIGTGPLGMLLIGLLARWQGAPKAVGFAEVAMLLILVVLAVWFRPLLRLRQEE